MNMNKAKSEHTEPQPIPRTIDNIGLHLEKETSEEQSIFTESRISEPTEHGLVVRISSKQLQAMSEYSEKISYDLKNKVKKLNNGYSCRICGFLKANRETLRAHLTTHREGNPYRCPLEKCSKLYPTHAHLTQHIKVHNPPTKLYHCKYPGCNISFRNRQRFKRHKLVHSKEKKFGCPIPGCEKRFNNAHDMKQHTEIHLKPEERETFKCAECGTKFLSKMGYYHHIRRHQGIQRERKFACNFCDAKFELFSGMEQHIRSHTKERPFQCKECKIWLASEAGLRNHGRVHKSLDPFLCPHCPKQFKWKNDLTIHLKMMHTENPKIYQCSHCSHSTVREKDLKRHVRTVHLKLHPHCCPLCPKTFASKDLYQIHVMMHGTERPFQCSVCGKGFATNGILNRHIQSHSKEKKFPCPQCDNRYKTSWERIRHLKHFHGVDDPKRRWREHSCYFCEKSYKGHGALVKHSRTHTLERPFKCTEPACSAKPMTSQEILTYHLWTKHGKGKPINVRTEMDERFQCEKCHKNYKYKGDLATHNKTNHGDSAPIHRCPELGCNYKTKYHQALSHHSRAVHLNITYKCQNNCGKRYKKKSDLVRHSKNCA